MLALLVLIASPVVILRTPTDIFPNINIPVIAVAWQFTGLNPEEMEGRITTQYERAPHDHRRQHRAHRVHDRQRPIDGQNLFAAECAPRYRQRAGDGGVADHSAPAPRRHAAPLIINYSASTVPILQLALSGLSESELNDVGRSVAELPPPQ